ncbi:MAG: DUF3592 domain-containing protein [Burkholderiales bacterium]|nr:DUF3592 domain-containing protein [Anaerolineae bacterium]
MDAFIAMIEGFSNILIPIFALFGIGGIVSGFRLGSIVRGSGAWKTTDAQLVEARLITIESKARVGVARVKIGENYQVAVRYAYKVDGREYVGDRIKVGKHAADVGTRSEGEKQAKKLRAASKLTVYYDPKNPEMAALQLGGDNSLILGNLIIGVIMLFAALAMLVYFKPYPFLN